MQIFDSSRPIQSLILKYEYETSEITAVGKTSHTLVTLDGVSNVILLAQLIALL